MLPRARRPTPSAGSTGAAVALTFAAAAFAATEGEAVALAAPPSVPPAAALPPAVADGAGYADPPLPAEAAYALPTSPPRERWYGWQILIPGIASHAVVAAGAFSGNWSVLFPALAASSFSGPVVHWAHGHVGRGFVSFAIEGGTATIVTAVSALGAGYAIRTGTTAGYYFTAGTGLGLMAVALALDAALLSHEPSHAPAITGGSRAWPVTLSIAPLALPSPASPDRRAHAADPPTPALGLVGQF